jgi:hypothetical protein
MARVDVKVVLLGQQSIGEVACCIAAAKPFFGPGQNNVRNPFTSDVTFLQASLICWIGTLLGSLKASPRTQSALRLLLKR